MSLTLIVAIVCTGIVLLILSFIVILLVHEKKIKERDMKIKEQKNNYEHQLLNTTLEIAEEERIKIARNIHDDLGMMLHAIQSHVRVAKRHSYNQEMVNESLEITESIVKETIDTIRSIAENIVPGPLINFGIIDGLKYLIDQINNAKIIEAELMTNEIDDVELKENIRVNLYLVIKEITNNIIKHAKASLIKIVVYKTSDSLNIIISHNGEGISDEAVKKLAESGSGIGLRSIMGRAHMISANIQYRIVDSTNSKIIIQIPLT